MPLPHHGARGIIWRNTWLQEDNADIIISMSNVCKRTETSNQIAQQVLLFLNLTLLRQTFQSSRPDKPMWLHWSAQRRLCLALPSTLTVDSSTTRTQLKGYSSSSRKLQPNFGWTILWGLSSFDVQLNCMNAGDCYITNMSVEKLAELFYWIS